MILGWRCRRVGCPRLVAVAAGIDSRLAFVVRKCLLVLKFMSTERTIGGWSERQRLAFIERLLYWRGTINRKDLCDHYGISLPQATKDLVTYTTLNPSACQYDVRKKCYVAEARMRPILVEPDFGADMDVVGGAMRTDLALGEFTLEPTRPPRAADQGVQRKLSVAAAQGLAVEGHYWSVHSGTQAARWMSPRAFGYDGLRWHVRAFCHRDEAFKDFVVGRFTAVGRTKPCPFAEAVDEDWLETETLRIRPNPKLSPKRRKAMAMDYGMSDGFLELSVRRAMRLYTLRRLGFVREPLVPPMLNEVGELEWAGD